MAVRATLLLSGSEEVFTKTKGVAICVELLRVTAFSAVHWSLSDQRPEQGRQTDDGNFNQELRPEVERTVQQVACGD